MYVLTAFMTTPKPQRILAYPILLSSHGKRSDIEYCQINFCIHFSPLP